MTATSKNKKTVGKKIDVTAKKSNAVKKVKAKKSAPKEAKKEVKSMNKFRDYCYRNSITQKDIREKTYMSIGTVNRLINLGKATDSMILLLSYALEIPETELRKMLETNV